MQVDLFQCRWVSILSSSGLEFNGAVNNIKIMSSQ